MNTPKPNHADAASHELAIKTKQTATHLQTQMRKILKPYDKDLRLYLQSANLFTSEEIEQFIKGETMLPLEQLVVLTSIMNKCLVLSFTGDRSAQIPLLYTGSPEDYMNQLRLNIYSFLAILDNEFNFMQTQREESCVSEDEVDQSIDLRSFEAVVLAARYRGFDVDVLIRSRSN